MVGVVVGVVRGVGCGGEGGCLLVVLFLDWVGGGVGGVVVGWDGLWVCRWWDVEGVWKKGGCRRWFVG